MHAELEASAKWFLSESLMLFISENNDSAAPYRRIPIAAVNFDSQFPPQRKAPELWRCEIVLKTLILLRAPKPNRHSRNRFHAA
ncbi:hypothetical protein TNCV_3233801 [Trichonephila clavipes]|nr:hypothetical protein TNCV_3233801 [Trichonephila clavipes]